MADIDNPQVKKFCNEVVRALANRLAAKHISGKLALSQFALAMALIPNDPAVTVVDGSETDGRTQITGADVWELMGIMQAEVDDFEANGPGGTADPNHKALLVLKIAPNPGL